MTEYLLLELLVCIGVPSLALLALTLYWLRKKHP